MNVDLSKNPKQEKFFNMALKAAFGVVDFLYLFYGGAIRGGKTFVCLAIFAFLAKHFAKSRWHVFRADMPALIATTVPSMEKIIAGSDNWKWNRDRSNYYVEYKPNGSRIFFKGENISHDPNLNDLLGLETNGILFEQIEELSEKLFEIGMSRVGSWYISPMPKPLILATFNPTQKWIKRRVYEPWCKNELKAPYFFMQALPSDNAYVTEDQWNAWGQLADQYQKQFIEGDWTDFGNQNNRWAFAYDPVKHTGKPKLSRMHTVYLSFDFNVNPMCCSVIQLYDNKLRVLETIKLADSNTLKMCEYIKVHYGGCLFMVTGDATGRNRNAAMDDNRHNYVIIQEQLNLSSQQLMVPAMNPPLESNKVLVNSILATYDVVVHEEKAKALHFDLGNVRIHPDGKIIKEDRKDPTQQADALDTFRYFCNTFMGHYLGG